MKLLYRTAEWHALAKLRMHTDSSLALLESLTTEFGLLMQNFQELTCSQFANAEPFREEEAQAGAIASFQSDVDQVAILSHRTRCAEDITVPAASSDRKC